MKYVYPAIFTPLENDQYDVYLPNLPHCRTCGNGLAEAIEMAEDAASMWLWDAENKKEKIPPASKTLPHEPPQFINFIKADTEKFRRRFDSKAVKKTLTIPSWLNSIAEENHVNFSSILQDALKQQLHLE